MQSVSSSPVVQAWHPNFVGHSFFKTALEKCKAEHQETELGKELIEHFEAHIKDLQELIQHYHPLTVELREKIKELFGSDKALNKVYSAGSHYIPLNFTKGILQRQDVGKKTNESADPVVNQAYDITAVTQQFYKSVHSIDLNKLLAESVASTLPLVSIVHYGGASGTKTGYDNAFWTPQPGEMVYGDGRFFKPLVGEPTVGIHEISHMVTQELGGAKVSQTGKPTGIDYVADAGGINEANSDQAAVAALQQKDKKMPRDEDCPWRIGQGLFRDNPSYALRDMKQPGNGYKDDPYLGSDPQAGYDDYLSWKDHAQDVDPHLSSAVGLKWYYETAVLCADAKNLPTWETVEKIRVAALPLCPANVTYPQYATVTMKVAQELFPETDAIWQNVGKAWGVVKVLT
ncbi:M4 family metallopeptidase [Candidatus Protochlamydia phocaeensis]|uniref:M4 family metallopeptidase n=1 Tax=Candidatus Protochlamydia phocaeensis TaxID=1414722 RepID=UPI0008389FD5|nr:M4 family metallopeptidase [Candidatus Protochlamydia phocaeensis]